MSTPEIEQLINKAESGDIQTMFALAQRYRDGDGVMQDYSQFLQWLMELRKRLGFSKKVKALLSFEGRQESELHSFVAWLQDSAASGNAMHMNFLAILYLVGIGIEKDSKQFIEWLHKAIAAGDAKSMGNLALAYREGVGIEKDLKQSIRWLYEAIAAGDTRSMRNLAWAYYNGTGVEKDPKQFIEWLYKAIAAGDPDSMNDLAGTYLLEGLEAEVDLELSQYNSHKVTVACDVESGYCDDSGAATGSQRSMYWFLRAAEAGNGSALDYIRRVYQSREFVTACLDGDIEWLTRAAVIDDGNLYAELAVKHWTRDAEGDHDKFQHWLRQGERQGNVRAFIFGSLLRLSDSQSLDRATISNLCEAFFELNGKVEEIKQQHLIRDDETVKQVAHFTTLDALHSMLLVSDGKTIMEAECYTGSRLLRLYHIAYMNDPQEGRRLLDLQHDNAELLREFFAPAEQGNNHNFLWENQEFSVYCGSFTLRVDRLDLWRAYGRDGAGYCVVIPAKVFQPEPESNPSHVMHDAMRRGDEVLAATRTIRSQAPALYRIRYQTDEAEKTLEALNPILNSLKEMKQTIDNSKVSEAVDSLVRIVISDILYLYKNEEYASEEEARMIVAHNIANKELKLDNQNPPRVYVETDAFLFQDEGTRIIIGPKVADKVAAELNLKYRLARHGLLKTTAVEWSQVKYR